jgi:hypothetical protein
MNLENNQQLNFKISENITKLKLFFKIFEKKIQIIFREFTEKSFKKYDFLGGA